MLENFRQMKSSAMQNVHLPNVHLPNVHLPNVHLPNVHLPNPFKDEAAGNKVTYNITVTTGAMKYAGTDSTVFVGVTGAGGEKSGLVKLDRSFHDDFERGSVDKFKVKMEDVGRPVILTIKHEEHGMFADWYATLVTVEKEGAIYRFPVNMWVTGTVDVAIGNAKLPHQEDNPVLLSFRQKELEKRQAEIKWRPRDDINARGLPGYLLAGSQDDLPRNLRLDEGMNKDFDEVRKLPKPTHLFEKFHEVFDKWDNLSDIKNIFYHPKMPKIPDFQANWERDEEFGRQIMNGCNPLLLKRCDVIPDKFPVTNEMVSSQLTRGLTLEQEVAEGNIYLVDLHVLEGLPCGKNPLDNSAYFSCAPMCLLYLNGKKHLVPVAIQLWQQPGPNNPIWGPDDSDSDWLLAKIYFRNAESNFQMIVEKMFYCHIVLEPFSVALQRCLFTSHPVYKLLIPHFRYICAGNVVIKKNLLKNGGSVDKLLSYGGGSLQYLLKIVFKQFNLNHLHVRKQIAANGTAERGKLPGYHFRDDAFLLWDSLEAFVREILNIYYSADEDVERDSELLSFVQEVGNEGFQWEDGNARGIPDAIRSIEQLVEFVTCLLFTSSCRYASVSNAMYDILMNVPNSPLNTSLPPPVEKGTSTNDTILQTLPDKNLSCLQVSAVHLLSKPAEEQVYLADYPSDLFSEDPARSAVRALRDRLQQHSATMRARNSSASIPYDYLLPERIPVASAI